MCVWLREFRDNHTSLERHFVHLTAFAHIRVCTLWVMHLASRLVRWRSAVRTAEWTDDLAEVWDRFCDGGSMEENDWDLLARAVENNSFSFPWTKATLDRAFARDDHRIKDALIRHAGKGWRAFPR